MKKKDIKANYIYNLSYQIFLIIIPILVTPYVARVLGEDSSGRYSYAYSIITYFTLFASLGFGYYAQREIAKFQKNREKQSTVFWEIVIAKSIPTIITLIIYLVMVSLNIFGTKYSILMNILSINIISVLFDIVFLFQGNEEFKKIVLRNLLIKILSIVMIFVFVKNQDDLWKYTLIQSLCVLISNISLWFYLPRILVKVKTRSLRPWKHLLPSFILFLPTIATSVYTSLDKTLIGIITGIDAENGNYEYAEKLIKMAMTLITSLGVVMIPRNSRQYAEGDVENVKKNVYLTSKFVFFLGVPLMFGCIAIADNLMPWYLGPGYDKAANIMKLLSPIIIIIGLSNVFGLQFLIPTGQDKKFTLSIICGAVTNLFLNIILIKMFMSYGAAISTVIAECVVTFIMLVLIRKNIDGKSIVCDTWKYWLSGVIMFIPCYLLGQILRSSLFNTAVLVFVGVSIYLFCLLFFKESFFLKTIRQFIMRKRKI